ncbi:response regulator [Candidatus Parabeggiatoa sp. HSG14]|uniref:response regulator n=1 Tax=Candidatus Parabeggiatoa sp. HSG14 TaxID=3055593 RepID=UPI0025A74E08|nr:response regulator [Thiotrichales bacterium HSG14]
MKLTIRTKLLLAFTLIITLSSAVNIYGLIQMNVLADLSTRIYNHPLQVTEAILTANTGIIKMHCSMKNVVSATNVIDIKKAHLQVAQYEKENYEQFAIIQKWILGKEGTALIAKTIQTFKEWSPIREEIIALMEVGQREKAFAINQGKGTQHIALLNSKMEILKNYAATKANGMHEDIQVTRTRVIVTTITVLLIVILLSVLFSLFISLGIIKPVKIISTIARQMVAGKIALAITNQNDIDKILTYRDEMGDIGRAFYAVAQSFKTVIDDIVQVSQGLAMGKLHILPKATYRGDFIQIKNALEMAIPNQCQIIEDIIQVSQKLAKGHLRVTLQAEYKGDFIQIKNALETGLSNLRLVMDDIVQVSQGLAVGNLCVTPKASYSGDFVQIKNALEMALSDLGQVVKDIVQVSNGLAIGNQNVIAKALYRGDFVQIKNALETAATKLAEVTTKNALQDWSKTGKALLNEKMRGEQDIAMLAKNTISFLTTYVNAKVGLFYLLKETQVKKQQPYLELIASYAYTPNNNLPHKFSIIDGLVGQVVLEKKTISFTQTPEECLIIIRSGLGGALPLHVILLPFLYENTVKGVIEIGSTTALTDIQQDFLEQVMSHVGIVINTVESRTKMRALLEQSQQQAEQLQYKQTELQQNNDELQSQAEKLQTQSEELQTQSEELRQTNEELEERTEELEKQKAKIQEKNFALEQSQAEIEKARSAIEIKAKELELTSKYKSEFLANMSHELRTPLNSLLILAQMLADNTTGNLTEEEVEYAQTIYSAGSDLHTLINEILDLSKVEAGKVELLFDDLILEDLVDALEKKFSHVAQKKGLTFLITIADDLPTMLYTDIQRLQQIINNLLSNAFKFTENGEVKLIIRHPSNNEEVSFLEFEPDKTIIISVRDTGIGIPKDKQQIIFEAFQQADGSTSRSYGGTGLGLSIARQLAKLLGGELKLESEEAKGSTFTLYLPEIPPKILIPQTTDYLPKVSLETPITQMAGDKSSSNTTIELSDSTFSGNTKDKPPSTTVVVDDRNNLQPGDRSILIIEDDCNFSNILMQLAQDRNFKCLIAEDGNTGLQLAQEYLPSAIILDIGLPQLDGWTVMERLKDNPKTRHIPVHFITAFDQQNEAKKMGAIGYLLKPVNIGEMSEAFKNIEKFLSETLKHLLVIVDNELRQQQILKLVESNESKTTLVTNQEDISQTLHLTKFDCIILDMDFEQKMGIETLKLLKQEEYLTQIPLIVYADRELIPEEEMELLQYEENFTVKTVRSQEGLLDETTLFLHQVEANLSQEKRQMLKMVHDKTAILKNKKVLIVDDDIRNNFALATVLENQNMKVFSAENGKEALKILNEHQEIAIILMDIMMPQMDGYEAMQKIREQLHFRQLPIIALTAKAMKGDKVKCIEAGANDYLSKPVDPGKLISLLRVWLYR